jgi:hypothetical protein
MITRDLAERKCELVAQIVRIKCYCHGIISPSRRQADTIFSGFRETLKKLTLRRKPTQTWGNHGVGAKAAVIKVSRLI